MGVSVEADAASRMNNRNQTYIKEEKLIVKVREGK